MKSHELEKAARKAILLLRKEKLRKGQPFMINSEILDTHQCFLEYPDGSFKIVEVDSMNCDFKIIMDAPPLMVKHVKKQSKQNQSSCQHKPS